MYYLTKQVENVKGYHLRDFTYLAKDKYWTARIYQYYVFRYENTVAKNNCKYVI
jgi:hypothetical protein